MALNGSHSNGLPRDVGRVSSKLALDPGVVAACREAAGAIAAGVNEEIAGKTTVSVERTVLRLLGLEKADESEIPLANVVVDHAFEQGKLGLGIGYWIGNAMIQTNRSLNDLALEIAAGELDLCALPTADDRAIHDYVIDACEERQGHLSATLEERREMRERIGEKPPPHRYVLTATGNIYEDVIHARAVADHGGDVIAVIRSTAQSLLDYVPDGPTTEGFGGTFATQANFRIMREALDEWAESNGRYVRVSSFCSGLCMPEIAVIGALEGFDNMVNDALYGILYRDINMVRTLIDQRLSRMINGFFHIVINTGEDNYLRTADALEAAPSVVASQLINFQLARDSGVRPEHIAIGNAFEIHPEMPNSLLLELAQAQLTRELFPDSPVKYMPPTRHMNGNPLRTHACDTLFNLVTVATQQGMQTIGVPTEGVFTPHIHDRTLALENVAYVETSARDFADDIEFKRGGVIQSHAHDVLSRARTLLEEIAETGLLEAIGEGCFGDVRRNPDEGRGTEGIVVTEDHYFNPLVEVMSGAPVP
jgi:beta-lysine 5,6-aminomutase alpha subunit